MTTRMKLARLALEAALGVPGVAAPHSSPIHRTADSASSVEGVLVTAEAEDRYAVGLHLVVRPVPLEALAGRVRAAVEAAVTRGGMAGALGIVSVRFEDIAEGIAPGTRS